MNRRIKTIAFALSAMTFASINTASAGGHRGIAGLVIGIARNHVSSSRTPIRGNHSHNHTSSYPTHHTNPPVVRSQPVYSQPRYSQPAYTQPTYSQPTHPQPTYSQPVPPQVVYSQPSLPSRSATISTVPVSAPAPSVIQTSGNTIQQNTMPMASNQQSITSPQSVPTNSDTGTSTELSALQMLASISVDEETTDAVAVQIPEFAAAAMPAIADQVGTWTVSLPGNQSLTLVLNQDNTFAWTAVKGGTSSSFEGQYRLEDGRLTLVRSNDLQQMSGSWNGEGANFTFKLDGATNSGLGFARN